jgi:hypothetical protein
MRVSNITHLPSTADKKFHRKKQFIFLLKHKRNGLHNIQFSAALDGKDL